MRPRELVHARVEAFNARDIETIASFYAVDATNFQMPEQPVNGREAIRAMFQRDFAIAEMVCIEENIFEDGEWAILEWRDPIGMRGCGSFHITGGEILFQRGYWDKLTFLRLHNLPFPG